MTNLSKLLVNDLKATYGNSKADNVKPLKKAEMVDLVATSFERIGLIEDTYFHNNKISFRPDPNHELGELHAGMAVHIFTHKVNGEAYAVLQFHNQRCTVSLVNFMEKLAEFMNMVSRHNSTKMYIKEQTAERGMNATIIEYGEDSITALINGESVKFGIGSEYSVMHVLNQHERFLEEEQEDECTYCNGGVCINCSPEQFLEDDQLEELGLAEAQVSPELEMLETVNEAFPNARFEGVGEDGQYTYFFGSTALDKADMTICVFGKDGENKFACSLEWEKEIHFDENETVILSEKECATPSEVVEFIRKESKKAYRKKKKNA